MSNMQMKEKIRALTIVAKDGAQIEESSKTIGMRIFAVFCHLAIIGLFLFAVSLFYYQHIIAGIITTIIACLITFFWYKIWLADDLPKDVQ